MSERQARLRAVLGKLTAEPHVRGAALVSRDGIHVLSSFDGAFAPETFSAMSATLMGAAEVALGELGGGEVRHAVADAGRVKLVVVGVGPELLLVALATADVQLDGFLRVMDDTAATLAAALGE